MKKHVVLATAALLSTSTFASMARMSALGQGDRGSHYLADTRNAFMNPATLNETKNYIVTEWGASTAGAGQGGFAKEMGGFVLGAYMNSGLHNQTPGSAFLNHEPGLDFFFAGDAGIQWGARLHYSGNSSTPKTGVKKTHSALGLGLGMAMGDIKAYANLDLSDVSKGDTVDGDEWKADLGMNLGADYKMGDLAFYADYDSTGYKKNIVGVTNNAKSSTSTYNVGVAKITAISASSVMVFDLSVHGEGTKSTAEGSTTETKTSKFALPLKVGFETMATSWLNIRGAVAQPLLGSETDASENKTSKATTSVLAGATLNFGKLHFDGSLGASVSTWKITDGMGSFSATYMF